MRTGPVSVTRTGRQMPPGFQAGSMWPPAWRVPVMLRRPWGSRTALQVTSTARAWPDRAWRPGHLEGVGDEVALGVAQVAPRPATSPW